MIGVPYLVPFVSAQLVLLAIGKAIQAIYKIVPLLDPLDDRLLLRA